MTFHQLPTYAGADLRYTCIPCGRRAKKEATLSRKLTLLTILTLALCISASADVLFTTLGPNGEYDPNSGWFVDGSNYHNQVTAMPFTPAANAQMTDAVLALGNYAGGNNPVNLYLYTDNGGQPGTQLATLTQHGVILPYDTGGGLVQFNCNGCGTVNQGTKYWLVAWEPDPNTAQAWMYAFQGHTGTWAFNLLGSVDGPWNLVPGTLSGYRVDGTSPEPGTLGLMGSGLIAAATGLRRKAGI